jgi:queuine tRNA-ribosyltransferase
MMCLDGYPAFPSSFGEAKQALERTVLWARRCLEAKGSDDQALFGVLPLWRYDELLHEAASVLGSYEVDGIVLKPIEGEGERETHRSRVEEACAVMPEAIPRFVLEAESLERMIEWAGAGADLCTSNIPLEWARQGRCLTCAGEVSLKDATLATQESPLDVTCQCYLCRHYSRAYLFHLYQLREVLATRLVAIHNVHTYLRAMEEAREAIEQGTFSSFSRRFLSTAPRGDSGPGFV